MILTFLQYVYQFLIDKTFQYMYITKEINTLFSLA
jgi:hypothetical protein